MSFIFCMHSSMAILERFLSVAHRLSAAIFTTSITSSMGSITSIFLTRDLKLDITALRGMSTTSIIYYILRFV